VTPAIGDRFAAPWGRYVVHRLAGDQVVLRDLDRATACVVVSPAELAAKYSGVQLLAAIAAGPPPTSPAPLERTPFAAGPRACPSCRQPAIAFARLGDGGPEYCWRCYGVEAEHAEPPPAIAATDWRPPPGETYDTRAEVGSFDPPPPEHQRPRQRAKPAPASRVETQDWLIATGQVSR
jgi:hypothetical protein